MELSHESILENRKGEPPQVESTGTHPHEVCAPVLTRQSPLNGLPDNFSSIQ